MFGKVLAGSVAVVLVVIIAASGAVMQKSTLTWPVMAPTRVLATSPAYTASGWSVASPFGWRPDPQAPGAWELHEGADLAGPMFCDGCSVPPLGDVETVNVGWDAAWGADPLHTGAGVVVDMQLQHPEESGTVLVRYGHLQPYFVWVRTQMCVQTVDCPAYHDTSVGAVSISCPGSVIPLDTRGALRGYAYATPGTCSASIAWPAGFAPDGPTQIVFDQQIVEGRSSSNAAVTFRAQQPPPLTPTPLSTATP